MPYSGSGNPNRYVDSARRQENRFSSGLGGPYLPIETAATSASFTLDAVILKTATASFTLDAVISGGGATVSASFTLDAIIRRAQTASFTLDAVIKATQSASFTLNSVLRKTQSASFTLDARFNPKFTLDAFFVFRPSFTLNACIFGEVPTRPQTIALAVGGNDVLNDIIYQSVRLGSQVNGQPGPASLWVRDLNHTYEFVTGQSLTFEVDGELLWAGFVTKAEVAYAFKVDDTENPQLTERIWKLEGVDYNILFSKRFLLNKANPTQELPAYPIGTRDDTMILDLVNRFLDLSSDSISTANVQHVAIVNLDKRFNFGNPGDTWGSAMTFITRPLGSIFYIDQDAVLNHVDPDIPDAPFALSDRPSQVPMAVGYRDMELTFNGTNLINDALVWGAGTGSINGLVTFAREEDATSITAHGRWQAGEFTTSMYTQASVNRRANTIVYGSPQNLRGAKDDAMAITVTTFTPGFRAGQKVRFLSEVFDFEDIIPIRRMVITFPTPRNPQFELFLSHEIDAPWSTYEFFFPTFNFTLNPPVIDIGDVPIGLPGGPVGCTYTVFDDFQRTEFSGWGETSGGYGPWHNEGSYNGLQNSVNGSRGVVTWTSGGPRVFVDGEDDPWREENFTMLTEIEIGTMSVDGSLAVWQYDLPGMGHVLTLTIGSANGMIDLDGESDSLPFEWAVGGSYFIKWYIDRPSGDAKAKVWMVGSDEPNWLLENSFGPGTDPATSFRVGGIVKTMPQLDIYTQEILFAINCPAVPSEVADYIIDDFGRSVGSSWGVATSGFAWDGTDSIPDITWSVSGSTGIHSVENTTTWSNTSTLEIPHDITVILNDEHDLSFRFRFSNVGNGSTTIRIIELNKEGWDFPTLFQIVFNSLTVGAQRGRIRLGTTGLSTELDKTDWLANTWYTAKWRVRINGNQLRIRAKVWSDSETEPDWMLSHLDAYASSPMDPGFTDTISVGYVLTHNPSITRSMNLDDIFVFAEGEPPADSVPTGAACFHFEGTGSQTVFTLPRAYQALTTEVYIDGLFQVRGVHYTESDPLEGEVTFVQAPPDNSTVSICSDDPTVPGAGGRPPLLL